MYTSSISGNAKVDVFLNFRRIDVLKGFISHLIHALDQQKIIRYFMNNEEEEKKESTAKRKQVPPKILGAISESKVAVVVLSKNYASSSWCLDELVEIMKKKSMTTMVIVPVYYEVDKLDVRDQTGSFGEDFQRHGQVESSETMERWKECLTKLAYTEPEFSRQYSKDEAKLIRDITRQVSGLLSTSHFHKDLLPGKACEEKSSCRLPCWSRPVSNKLMDTISGKSYSPIAMDRQTESINEILELSSVSEVRVIGISGITGIGKTTIARHLYKKLASGFRDPYFVESPRNILDHSSGAQGPIKSNIAKYIIRTAVCHQNDYSLKTSRNLHDKVLSALFGELLSPKRLKRKATQTLCSKVGSDDNKGTRICHKGALVIVDDVEIKELEEIMEGVNQFCSGSRVIVTTRDKSLLLERGVEHVYEVDCLKYDEALELFSECAFQKQYPPANFEQLSVRAVTLTGCLPLGIKLLGSFLCGRTEEDWECKLEMFEERQGEAIAELSRA